MGAENGAGIGGSMNFDRMLAAGVRLISFAILAAILFLVAMALEVIGVKFH